MPAIILPQTIRNILVIGPIYNKIDKLPAIEDMISKYDYTIFNGGLLSTLDNIGYRFDKITKLMNSGKVIYLAGRLDYLLSSTLKDFKIAKWINNCPNIAICKFVTRFVQIMDGGLTKDIESYDYLIDNLEVSFISKINDRPWHQFYNGGLGYVISNNPISDKPNYYNYSMQLGTEGSIYAQEVDENGLKKTILL